MTSFNSHLCNRVFIYLFFLFESFNNFWLKLTNQEQSFHIKEKSSTQGLFIFFCSLLHFPVFIFFFFLIFGQYPYYNTSTHPGNARYLCYIMRFLIFVTWNILCFFSYDFFIIRLKQFHLFFVSFFFCFLFVFFFYPNGTKNLHLFLGFIFILFFFVTSEIIAVINKNYNQW